MSTLDLKFSSSNHFLNWGAGGFNQLVPVSIIHHIHGLNQWNAQIFPGDSHFFLL